LPLLPTTRSTVVSLPSLHDALPIWTRRRLPPPAPAGRGHRLAVRGMDGPARGAHPGGAHGLALPQRAPRGGVPGRAPEGGGGALSRPALAPAARAGGGADARFRRDALVRDRRRARGGA